MTSKFGYVVICGAVPPTVRSVRLYSVRSHQYVNVHENSTVMARFTEENAYLTLSSHDKDLKLLIHSPKKDMYLCYNRRWKLVGRRITRQEALNHRRCQFLESMFNGYNLYESAANSSFFIGFNAHGLQVRKTRAEVPWRRHECFYFMKISDKFSIDEHNNKLGGETLKRPVPVRSHHNKNAISRNNRRSPHHNQIENKPRCPPKRINMRHRPRFNRKGCEDT